jgi:peptidoglycan/LPS O-acetylase OafA/YrhL
MSLTVIPGLTPIRGIAALYVFLLHYTTQVYPSSFSGTPVILFNGRLAVELFFMLSGVVLAHAYLEKFGQGVNRTAWVDFMVNRFARVWPLAMAMALFALSLFIATQWWLEGWSNPLTMLPISGRNSWLDFLSLITLTSGLFENVRFNYPQWSITAEVMGYLVAPFAIAAVATIERRYLWWIVALGLVPHLLIDLISYAFRFSPDNVISLSLFGYATSIGGPAGGIVRIDTGIGIAARCIGLMMSGMALCRIWRHGGLDRLAHPLNLLVASACLIFVLTLPRPDTLILIVMLWTMACTMVVGGRTAAIVNANPLVWLGEISFSIYLIHAPLQILITNLARGFDIQLYALSQAEGLYLLAGTSLIVVGLSHLSWRFIEIPARQHLRGRWQQHRRMAALCQPSVTQSCTA